VGWRMTKELTTGALAKQANVNIETIRYYERRGLIPEPARSESGYRKYPLETVQRIVFIKHAKELGFTLNEIDELLSIQIKDIKKCDKVKREVQAKIKEVQEKIINLSKIKSVLEKLIEICDSGSITKDCPIIECLYSKVENVKNRTHL